MTTEQSVTTQASLTKKTLNCRTIRDFAVSVDAFGTLISVHPCVSGFWCVNLAHLDMTIFLEHQMMNKSIYNTSSGKPTIPPKPNLKASRQSSHFGSSSRVAHALRNFEQGMGKQTAGNYNSKERRYFENISQDGSSVVPEARLSCPPRTKDRVEDISSFSRLTRGGQMMGERNLQPAVDDVDVGRSGSEISL